ncbi:hypothetical protein CIK05_03770 [Bdellovibrio sp. qaytius]|nr:hypothetical protein CIK05_03770 [Bdellovibrio sp. qaytius]
MLGYSPLYLVILSGTGVNTGTPYTTKYELIYGGSAEAGLDLWNVNQHSWGFISGVQISQERKMFSGKVNGQDVNTTTPTAKFQTSFIYLGAAYKWESFYVPLAITYGISKIEPAAGATGTTTEIKTGAGALLGFGYFFSDSFAIEYIGRSATMKLKFTNGADHEENEGAISAPLLNLKYFF